MQESVGFKMEVTASDILASDNNGMVIDSSDIENANTSFKNSTENLTELQQQVIANFQKPNLPNVNVPERIIICLDVCYDDNISLYKLGDGTTFTPINMMKRILDFFLHSKHAINRRTEFALLIMKDTEPFWVQNFTNCLKDIFNAIDYINAEGCTAETFDFKRVFQIIKQKVEIPQYEQGECLTPPPFVVRMLVLYGRSNCIPIIPQEDIFLNFLKKQMYFYIDILLAHEDECGEYKCEDIYDALQNLDNGYSYVYEVSRNATKIHDCIAKLLAHPLQRPLQRIANYTFGTRQ